MQIPLAYYSRSMNIIYKNAVLLLVQLPSLHKSLTIHFVIIDFNQLHSFHYRYKQNAR